jgi:hypothetical protein
LANRKKRKPAVVQHRLFDGDMAAEVALAGMIGAGLPAQPVWNHLFG